MPTDTQKLPVHMIGYKIKQLQHGLRTRMDVELRAMGLSTAHYALLTAIGQGAEASSADLARRCFIKPSSIRELIVRLERDGMIERHSSEADGRVIKVNLTSTGKRALGAARNNVKSIEAEMLRGLSGEEQSTLSRLLGRCVEAFEV